MPSLVEIDDETGHSVVEVNTDIEVIDLYETVTRVEAYQAIAQVTTYDTPPVVVEAQAAAVTVIEILTGKQGEPGPPGPSSTFYYEHDQVLASAGWNIVHNLGKKPNVTVLIGDVSIAVAVQHLDNNNVYIPFAIPIAGKAICS